ncbi:MULTISPECIES: nitroreductase family protein [Paenibacillus]|uniref:Nitroreductase family protein n=1 Tax=Paenibacillus violae TaxID=3077234 RepID=A0ABU3R803_9BACL|nr:MULTISPECIES: nitroreductase family protein [Paenibacillus]MDU0200208.1 nitroreductase family protein [Paenibacillus sp. PFR10]MEC0270149.1 nitroreductase family protein [Paenibacillus anseongense]
MTTSLPVEVESNRQPDHEINPQFLTRWSPRSFTKQEVTEDVLLSLFEAARWAPSGSNIQPWRFIVARTEEQLAKFHSFIAPANREWCEKAPVLALVISYTKSSNGNTSPSHAFDAGAAWGYLALEANNQGLITHAMGGFDHNQARETLQIPEDYQTHAVIAIGYRGPVEALPERFQEREAPSTRRPVSELLFEGTFGQTR